MQAPSFNNIAKSVRVLASHSSVNLTGPISIAPAATLQVALALASPRAALGPSSPILSSRGSRDSGLPTLSLRLKRLPTRSAAPLGEALELSRRVRESA